MNFSNFKIGSMLLSIGVLLYCCSMVLANWYKIEPVAFLVDLKAGASTSASFLADLNTRYLIDLEVDRNLNIEKLDCVLGINAGTADYCENIVSPVEIKWSVSSVNGGVANGISGQKDDGAWGKKISRTIGQFSANADQQYFLQVQSLSDASILTPANPRVVVRMHPSQFKDLMIAAQILVMIGIVFVVAGLWLLIVNAVRRAPSTEFR